MSFFGVPLRNGLPIGLGSSAGFGVPAFNPQQLFSNGEQGVWYDPSDFSTMFQDVAGTTPVTAVGQSVALICDKSGGGNNATQSVAGSRPTVNVDANGKYFLLFDGIDDSMLTSSINFSAGATNTPLGSELILNGTFDTNTANWTAVNSPTLTVGSNGVTIQNNGTTNGLIYQGISTVVGRYYKISAQIVFIGPGFARVETSNTIPTTVNGLGINVNASGTYTLTFLASATTTYIVCGNRNDNNASNTYDNISVKELLNSNLAPDKMTLWAGLLKSSDAAQGVVAELSATIASNNGTFLLSAPNSAAANYNWSSKGTTQVNNTVTTYTAPNTAVLTGQANIAGPSNIIRVNGVQAGSVTTTQGSGNFGNYQLYIGRRNNATLPFNGRLYSLIVRGAASTAVQVSNTEYWVADRTGISL